MQRLDWLAYSADEEGLATRVRRRTRDASEHLHLLAEHISGHGLHLVLDEATDIQFSFEPRHLPPWTVDRRFEGDALATAIADPHSVLVTGGGPFLGQPAARDARWDRLAELGRSRATLVSSPLSGRYYGLFVDGLLAITYRAED